jgi:metal-sulfur cluster biosynthetic enzyme
MAVTEMDRVMQQQLTDVLERVKDPESGVAIARLGVVERFRYNAEEQQLIVFTDFAPHMPSCITCVGIAAIVIDGIRRRLLQELQSEFPDLTVTIV